METVEVKREPYFLGRTPNRSQMIFGGAYLGECWERYYLGTPGCGKSSAVLAEVNRYCQMYPGSTWLLARYTEREAESILRGDFERETPREILDVWDYKESRWRYRNGSSVYIHGLRPAEGQAEFSKFAGYTLSGVALSQVESIPPEYIEKLMERLRHPNPPRFLLAEGNVDVGIGHWLRGLVGSGIAVGERVYRSGPRLIVVGNLEDNAPNLPADQVQKLWLRYPPGHPLHGPKVSGDFGLVVRGDPVYGPNTFKPEVHLVEEEADADEPLLEAWDFGIARPAVLWSQFLPGGRWRVLGEYLGDGTPLEEAMTEAARLRGRWFGNCETVWRTGDPSGEQRKDTGKSSLQFLRDRGLAIRPARGANAPAVRAWAIQQISGMMQGRTQKGERFGVHPRCKVFIEGLQGGYQRNPAKPEAAWKDGFYDHLQNCAEYALTAFWRQGFGVSRKQAEEEPHKPRPRATSAGY